MMVTACLNCEQKKLGQLELSIKSSWAVYVDTLKSANESICIEEIWASN